jgi:hypothetical protein
MRILGLIVLLAVVAAGAWGAWTYVTTEPALRDIASGLPAEEALNGMSLEESVEALRLAAIECRRVARFEANPLARLLRGDEIKSLAEHCELIKFRQEALQGP